MGLTLVCESLCYPAYFLVQLLYLCALSQIEVRTIKKMVCNSKYGFMEKKRAIIIVGL